MIWKSAKARPVSSPASVHCGQVVAEHPVTPGPVTLAIANQDTRRAAAHHGVTTGQLAEASFRRPIRRTRHDQLRTRHRRRQIVTLAELDGRYLSTEVAAGFTGRVIGMYVTAGQAAFSTGSITCPDATPS